MYYYQENTLPLGDGGWNGVHRTKLPYENTAGIDRFDGMGVQATAILMQLVLNKKCGVVQTDLPNSGQEPEELY